MRDPIIAVVPIRSFTNGKTRLSPLLSPEQRAALLRRSAETVIEAALRSHVVDTVVVVSPDPEVLAWVAELGGRVLSLAQPSDRPGLNGAIDAARDWALERDADGLLSLFADLPLLSPVDIRRMVASRKPLVLGPDRRGEGTNAILLRLQGAGAEFRFSFGQQSLAKHLAEAERLRLGTAIEATPGIGFDLDTPLDWADFLGARERAPEVAQRLLPCTPCGAQSA